MSLLDQLNEHQLEAVKCIHSHVRIIAGAGSGKTRVVTTRIAYLIQQCGIYPNKVLAITFTNKAAKEMKERVEVFLKEVSKAVNISTIHAFCVRFLREEYGIVGYPRNFTILDSDDQKSILRDAYKRLQVDVKSYSYQSVIGYISGNKTNFIRAKEALETANAKGWENDIVKAKLYSMYEQQLRDRYALDFDDLLIFTHRILQTSSDVRKKWQRRFTYIHVDEFQDVDNLQYSIIKYLVKEDSFLCVVGDPDQTIYTWRGAQVDIIMNFEHDFPESKTIVLNENYRSTKHILDGANALIKHNQYRIDKDLFTRQEGEGKIIQFTAIDDTNEPVWVASKIKSLYHSGEQFKNIAILYRSNYLSRGLEKALLDFQIPYRIYGGTRFYDRAEIKDALSYLRLLVPPQSDDRKALYKDLAIKRILNVPRRGIGDRTFERIAELAQQEDINMYDVIANHVVAKGRTNANIQAFVQVIEKNKALLGTLSIHLVLEKVLEESGYLQMLQMGKEIERLENIKELSSDIANYAYTNPEGSLVEYLQEISLYTDKENENEEDSSFVQLMSIHAAKGLEFDNVFVYSLCEGIFPNEKSIQEGGHKALEEERRLAYVAFTRARKMLYISASSGYSYVLGKGKTISRFVRELPADSVQDVGARISNCDASDTNTYSGRAFFAKDQSTIPIQSNVKNNGIADEIQIKKRKKIRKGELVHHETFGDGVVIQIEGENANIAFEQKYGVKTMKLLHPLLTKK